jgi:hypothetical protein
VIIGWLLLSSLKGRFHPKCQAPVLCPALDFQKEKWRPIPQPLPILEGEKELLWEIRARVIDSFIAGFAQCNIK